MEKLTCKTCLIKDTCTVSTVSKSNVIWPCSLCKKQNTICLKCRTYDCKFEIKEGVE